MENLRADFELLPRKKLEAEMILGKKAELEATFEIHVSKDATINGVNTLELTAQDGLELIQEGNVATISGAELQRADEELSQRIDNVVQDKTFVFEQGVASSVWVINHNLNKYPSVSIVDSSGNMVVADVKYDDINTCTVTMVGALKGKAYLN